MTRRVRRTPGAAGHRRAAGGLRRGGQPDRRAQAGGRADQAGRPPPAAAPTATTVAAAATPAATTACQAGCGGAPAAAAAPKIAGNLTVFTAASLTEAFTEMGKAIEEANPGAKVAFNFAGSPALRTQLREGAKADVFASADEPNMQGAQQDGTIGGDPRIFVQNKLVAIVAQPEGRTRSPSCKTWPSPA